MNRRTLMFGLACLPIQCAAAASGKVDLHGSQATLRVGLELADKSVLLEAWVKKSADAVVHYYGRFPVPEVVISIKAGDEIGGVTNPGNVPTMDITADRNADETALLKDDWVMVHEMIHLAFPWLNGEHNWMTEGLAVYVESIARVQAGHLPEAQIWHDFVTMMPRGLPRNGEGGFEVTKNRGRSYWGGALFCLLADVRMRQETDNKLGLQHALQAINSARDFRKQWDFRETLQLGDAATGRHVLESLFDEMKDKAVVTNLDKLWEDLGLVGGSDGPVSFDETAPLAAIRKAIVAP